jgi:sortase A
MARAPKWFHRLELSLWFVGISLVGGALGATWDRHHYQAQQQRAFTVASEQVMRVADSAPAAPQPTDTYGPSIPADIPQTSDLQDVSAPASEEVLSAPVAEPASVEKKEPPPIDPNVLGRIEIPRIGMKAIVRDGADEGTLARAVGLVPGTARPGEEGNVVLAGHRDSFFRPLRRIRMNDRIRLVTPGETYEYQVASLRVVEPTEVSVLDSRGVEEITLITCYPFRFIGTAPERFIVTATRVD